MRAYGLFLTRGWCGDLGVNRTSKAGAAFRKNSMLRLLLEAPSGDKFRCGTSIIAISYRIVLISLPDYIERYITYLFGGQVFSGSRIS